MVRRGARRLAGPFEMECKMRGGVIECIRMRRLAHFGDAEMVPSAVLGRYELVRARLQHLVEKGVLASLGAFRDELAIRKLEQRPNGRGVRRRRGFTQELERKRPSDDGGQIEHRSALRRNALEPRLHHLPNAARNARLRMAVVDDASIVEPQRAAFDSISHELAQEERVAVATLIQKGGDLSDLDVVAGKQAK